MTTGVRLVSVGPVGTTLDDEAAAVLAALAEAGVTVESRISVDDEEAALERALGSAAPLTVIVAGPGGSTGDVVRRVVARATSARLVLNERMLAALEAAHRRQERPLPRRDERLALLPQGAIVWTAEGAEPAWALGGEGGAFVVLARGGGLPPALARQVTDFAGARMPGRGVTLVRTLRTAGASLGEIEERLADWLGGAEGPRDTSVTTVAADGEVWVRLRARGATRDDAVAALSALEPAVAERLGADCYGRDAETLEQAVGRLLVARGLTLSVAESCTGGLLGHRLTNIAGSSAFFERGVVVYSNRAKEELLGVPGDVLRTHGAVSAPCAEAMARGICSRSGSPCGLAITGIAGPDGGSVAKPVGTVFIGVAVGDEVAARRFRFHGGRAAVKWQSAQMALDMLRRKLGGV